jgi:YVTN family beta-propeller protein
MGQHYAYITNMGLNDEVQDDLSVIDLANNTVVATVPVGHFPQGVAVNPSGTAVYVANTGNSFTVIDTTTFASTTIEGPGGIGATGVAVNPHGTRIYVTNPEWWAGGAGSKVWVIDRATNAIIDEVACGTGTCGIAVHPDGKTVYVTNAFDGTIAVFDATTHAVLDTIALETVGSDEQSFPVPLVMHPEGTFVYAANRQGPTFWAINTATHEVLALPFGHSHVCMGIHPDGSAVYVTDVHDRNDDLPPQGTTVDVIDTETLDLITTINGMNGPLGVDVHPDGTRLYVVNGENDTVSVVDAVTYAHIASIPVGTKPIAYGQFIGPGVPRLLKSDAMARLEAVKESIAGSAEGVVSPQYALEHLELALTSGNLCVQADMWLASETGEVDPRRLQAAQGGAVFEAGQTMVKAVLDAIRRGWITNADLRSELLAIADAALRADRVLAAVAIDDAIVGQENPETIEQAQTQLENGGALVKEARLWGQMDKKATLLTNAISAYQQAWQTASD